MSSGGRWPAFNNTYSATTTLTNVPIGALVSVSGHGGDRQPVGIINPAGFYYTGADSQIVFDNSGDSFSIPCSMSGMPGSTVADGSTVSGASVTLTWGAGSTTTSVTHTPVSWSAGSFNAGFNHINGDNQSGWIPYTQDTSGIFGTSITPSPDEGTQSAYYLSPYGGTTVFNDGVAATYTPLMSFTPPSVGNSGL